MAPFTLKCHITPITSKPSIASTNSGFETSPQVTSVDWSATTMPAPFNPTMVINKPMPAEMPYFKFCGMLFTSVSLNLNSDKITKTMPSTKIAVRATCQGSFTPIPAIIGHTVYAK